LLAVLKLFVPHRGGNEFELLPTHQDFYRTFLGVNYAIYNKHQAVVTLIVKSTTLLFGDWLSPLPVITKADISIIMSSKP